MQNNAVSNLKEYDRAAAAIEDSKPVEGSQGRHLCLGLIVRGRLLSQNGILYEPWVPLAYTFQVLIDEC